MSARAAKRPPRERLRGEVALCEFTEYVENQQALRYPGPGPRLAGLPLGASRGVKVRGDGCESHAELDVLSDLDLAVDEPTISLRDLLLALPSVEHDGNASSKKGGSCKRYARNVEQVAALLDDRLNDGSGETVIDLGIETDGESMELTVDEWHRAVATMKEAASCLNANCEVLLTRGVGGPKEAEPGSEDLDLPAINSEQDPSGKAQDSVTGCTGKVLVRRSPRKPEEVIETRIVVVGNVDAGKSSMLGVLVKGDLDDGRGKARVNLFRHKHEIETGRTSSVGMEIMGFDVAGNVVMSDTPGRKLNWEEIGRRSAKVITFNDLAGHERYLRTTVFGMLSSEPNYCLLMVAANNGLIGMSKEHLGLALALNVPIMIVITKIDICPAHVLEQTVGQISKILRSAGARKMPVFVKTHADCVNTATQFVSQRLCPIFQVSNVTGENLDLVRKFLNILPHHGRYNANVDFEFHVNDIFSVPFVGTVVSGIVKSGLVYAGDEVWLGPDSLGHFAATSIRSIQRKRINVPTASAGQSASFALKKVRRKDVRKGMVLLNHKADAPAPKVYREFVAEVLILSHATTIKPKYQAMLHVGPVSQTCAILDIDKPFMRTGDRALVAFQFVQHAEYLVPGDRLIFREGRTKGLGIVKSIGYDPSVGLMANTENTQDAAAKTA